MFKILSIKVVINMFFNQVKDEITKMSKENYDENIMNFISNLFSYNLYYVFQKYVLL